MNKKVSSAICHHTQAGPGVEQPAPAVSEAAISQSVLLFFNSDFKPSDQFVDVLATQNKDTAQMLQNKGEVNTSEVNKV